MQCLPKLFSLALNDLLTTKADEAYVRAPTQSGFRRRYRVEDNSVLLKIAIEKCHFMKGSLYCLFIDLKKAYDSINRARLWEVLVTSVPEAVDITKCIRQLYV
jgi:hypothetical protein